MKGTVVHIDPEGLYTNPLFTQVVMTSGNLRTVRVAGQVSVDAEGRLVGAGDLAVQAAKVFENVGIALAAAGAGLANVIRWNFYLLEGQPASPVIQVYRELWADRPNPPIVNLIYVAGLASPDYLFELETLAIVPEA